MSVEPKYRRILLKLSGEALGAQGSGIDAETVRRIAGEVKRVHELGVEVAMVIGGGNMWRGQMLPRPVLIVVPQTMLVC
ncbi:hypothetical protein KDK_12360 [Dictyobacter kobayashii]|uniref:Aspartate/glutamate/uridylate kinase domain-containing protein n=1 Tax=Dictyobacter kobayashii TaxID=2014872 RepID=A0A402AEC1_9CHLR|nr:hypothetical protein [Dictyobacter kobayashii]GCE17436.1 hypothetical protein KDK_12360 [Dictyobacter kobayashii]